MFEVHGFAEECMCQWCGTARDIIGGDWAPASERERASMLAALAGTVMPGAAVIA